MFDERLAKKIKKKLIDKNMSQKELAERVGSTLSYVNQILNCKCENIIIETKILEELNIDDTRTTIR